MATLANFVAAVVPTDLQTRGYTGPRNWIALVNQLLRRLEREGLVSIDRKKTVGLEINNQRGTIPTDCRKINRVYYIDSASELEVDIEFDVVDGMIKVYDDSFQKSASPSTFTLSAWATTGVSINDTDAVADQWIDYLLTVTNGSLSGKTFLIADNAAVGAGVSVLTFYTPGGVVGATSTAGYLTDTYLIVEYEAGYTVVTASPDELPVGDMFESVLTNGLCQLACTPTDKRYMIYKNEFETELMQLKDEMFSPSPSDRPSKRPMPGFDNNGESESSYIGEE
jgi:hypothetical protein